MDLLKDAAENSKKIKNSRYGWVIKKTIPKFKKWLNKTSFLTFPQTNYKLKLQLYYLKAILYGIELNRN